MKNIVTPRTLRAILRGVVLAWFVVTYTGQRVAGPFSLLTDCTDLAKIMAKKYSNVSPLCQAF